MICKQGRKQDLPDSTFPPLLPPQQKNAYMVVHMWDKWRKVVPQEFWKETCPEPTPEQLKAVKKEGKMRGELKEWKKSQKRAAVNKMESAIWGEDGGGKPQAKKPKISPMESEGNVAVDGVDVDSVLGVEDGWGDDGGGKLLAMDKPPVAAVMVAIPVLGESGAAVVGVRAVGGVLGDAGASVTAVRLVGGVVGGVDGGVDGSVDGGVDGKTGPSAQPKPAYVYGLHSQ